VPRMVPGAGRLGASRDWSLALLWVAAGWAHANPETDIIQKAATRQGITGRKKGILDVQACRRATILRLANSPRKVPRLAATGSMPASDARPRSQAEPVSTSATTAGPCAHATAAVSVVKTVICGSSNASLRVIYLEPNGIDARLKDATQVFPVSARYHEVRGIVVTWPPGNTNPDFQNVPELVIFKLPSRREIYATNSSGLFCRRQEGLCLLIRSRDGDLANWLVGPTGIYLALLLLIGLICRSARCSSKMMAKSDPPAATGPIHGYGIVQRLQQVSRGCGSGSPRLAGSCLTSPRKPRPPGADWKETETGREAKFYRLTRKGRVQLENGRRELAAIGGGVGLILKMSEGCAP
jgi:PadR family transcriptional regulator PadR